MIDAQQVIADEKQYVAHTYTRPNVVFTHGEGVTLYDENGKTYLDFCAGIAVNAIGHSDPDWVAAVSDQAGKLVHVSNLYHTAPHTQLAKKLVEASFADKVYFGNSGAEANEGALKFARKFAYVNGRSDKTTIVSFSNAFHGRTVGALSVTPREKYQKYFRPLMPGSRVGEFNSIESAEEVIQDDVCAVFIEPIQGEGGIRPSDPKFLRRVRELCDEHNAVLIFDEVQCGLGRTGFLWAHEAYGVTPDIMTLAKPLAGGLPICAVLVNKAIADTIKPGDHASTFGAGPLVTRAANVVFDKVSHPDFLARVREMGEHLHEQLSSKLPEDKVVEIRGLGMMLGIEMTIPVAPLVPKMAERGLLTVGAGEKVLRLVPPLIVTEEDVDHAVAIIAQAMSEVDAV